MGDENSTSNSYPSSTSKKRQPFSLFNTQTKKKEMFAPNVPGEVGMYVCGVTAYDLSHIGHARAYVAFDVLFRYLLRTWEKGFIIRNFHCTVVSSRSCYFEKIINRAKEYKEQEPLSDPLKLSAVYCDEFLKDMDDLQCLRPSHQPRVSDNIEAIIEIIEELIKKDCAYCLDDGDVYFSVDKFERYGQLSKRNLKDNRAGERVSADHRKRNLADFALWKSAKPGEIFWPSPWGNGRPGWHIECSAMSAKYLTYSFDIHGGGEDLIFPHHENELAQSRAACDEAHIGYWMHIGFVNINGDKMSKSTKNYLTIREVTGKYHPLALRYFLLSMNYGSHVNFSLPQADLASDAIFRVYQTLQDCRDALRAFQKNVNEKAKPNSKTTEAAEKLKDDLEIKMNDNLNVAEILKGSLQDALKSMNNEIKGLKKKQNQQKLLAVQSLAELEAAIRDVLEVLGLLSAAPYSEVLQQMKEKALLRAEITEAEVSLMIDERAMARKSKDFLKSDLIRIQLTSKGVSLMDLPNGSTIWRPCVPEGKDY